MKGLIAYLDSSSIVKRYIEEHGSKTVRSVYLKAYSGESSIAFSSWNIGETLGAFDRACVKGTLSPEDYLTVKRRFLIETRRLLRLGILTLVPIKFKLLVESWDLIEKHHIYEADALQIASAKAVKAAQFFTADKKVHETANREGLKSTLTT